MAYVISNHSQHIIEALSDVNGGAIHGVITYDKCEGVLRLLGSAMISQTALLIKSTRCDERACCI